jgi:hypothetical protein
MEITVMERCRLHATPNELPRVRVLTFFSSRQVQHTNFGFHNDGHFASQQQQQHQMRAFEKGPFAALDHVNRKIIPLPTAKRQRYDGSDDENCRSSLHQNTFQSNSPRLRKQSRSPFHAQSPPASPTRPAQPVRVNTGSLLDPCHICRRKPTKKSDLDSYAECQGCKARTCFVCLRECQGWFPDHLQRQTAARGEDSEGDIDIAEQEALSRSFHMADADDTDVRQEPDHTTGDTSWTSAGEHRTVVCSQCCIERGAEGDVVCLGCLSRSKEM